MNKIQSIIFNIEKYRSSELLPTKILTKTRISWTTKKIELITLAETKAQSCISDLSFFHPIDKNHKLYK